MVSEVNASVNTYRVGGNTSVSPTSRQYIPSAEYARDTVELSTNVNPKTEKQKGFFARHKVLTTLGIATATIVACLPQTRFAARNLIGEKGIDKFIQKAAKAENKEIKDLGKLAEELQKDKEFAKQTQGMSYWNIRRMLSNINKMQSSKRIDIAHGKFYMASRFEDGTGGKNFFKKPNGAYSLYRTVKTVYRPIDRFITFLEKHKGFCSHYFSIEAQSKEALHNLSIPEIARVEMLSHKPKSIHVIMHSYATENLPSGEGIVEFKSQSENFTLQLLKKT